MDYSRVGGEKFDAVIIIKPEPPFMDNEYVRRFLLNRKGYGWYRIISQR